MFARQLWRKFVNYFMFSMTGLCALIAVGVLFFILGYLVWNGGSSLSWAFLTHLPTPVGERGGGMANAIVGSGKLLLLASAFGIPIGFLGGVYLAEFGGRAFPFVVRYTADLLNGVPSIVMGIFAYTIVVLPMKHFSTLAGGLALGVMMIPIAVRSTEEALRTVPLVLREGALALGASKWKNDRHGGRSGRPQGNCHGHHPRRCACGRGDGAAFVHRLQQSILEPWLEPADGFPAGHGLYLRHLAVRGLAPAGLGCRIGSPDSGACGEPRRKTVSVRAICPLGGSYNDDFRCLIE